jgi:hypothetical protein
MTYHIFLRRKTLIIRKIKARRLRQDCELEEPAEFNRFIDDWTEFHESVEHLPTSGGQGAKWLGRPPEKPASH